MYAPIPPRPVRALKKTKTAKRAPTEKRKKRKPNYWERVKEEIHILLCTNDQKYASLRHQLSSKGSRTQTAIVSTISAAVGAKAGFVAGAVVPLAALCLLAVLQLGKEAYCAGFSTVKIK